ncbi:uncharacterized protein LOC142573986 [Dermacentor variabilis]|uniref:uncharacterized protein LOC142573986 n=1 Tax=Dermacentor variabilis TaxID=34621 RepID=UPI003F5CB2F6
MFSRFIRAWPASRHTNRCCTSELQEKEVKPKLSFGSTSGGPSNLTSNMKVNLPEHFALLEMQLKPDVPENALKAAASKRCFKGDITAAPGTTLSDKCKSRSSHSTEPLNRRKCEASVSNFVLVETSFTGEPVVIVNEEPAPKALAESEVIDRLTQLREALQEKDPSEEDDRLEALSPSQTQLILVVHRILTALLDRRPGPGVVRDVLYSLIYYQEHNDEDACSCTFLLQDGAAAMSGSLRSNYSRRQHAEGDDGGPRRAGFSSSSSNAYEFVVDGEEEEQKIRRMKDGWNQAPAPPCLSRALQAVQETCDAETQTQEWELARFAVLEIAELGGRLEISGRTLQGRTRAPCQD